MINLKLKSVGKKHERSFRIVVQEKRSKVLGKSIEDLGFYNPKTHKIELNRERVDYWLGVGALPTPTVSQLLKKSDIILRQTQDNPERS